MQPQRTKIVKRGKEARDAALVGVQIVYDAVSATLGPRSANVGIARPYGRPAVVHDGVTVAKEVLPLADPFENFGAELVVEAADRTNGVGDGTTTATVLTHGIATRAHTQIAAGSKPMALRAGIEAATAAVATELTALSLPIEKTEDVRRIATVSAQNEEIGDMVAAAYDKLGREGLMSVEESRSSDTYLEIKTGMEFDRGYKSPYFISDPQTNEAVIEDASILVTDMTIQSLEQYGPMIDRLVNNLDVDGLQRAEGAAVRNIVIICKDMVGEALPFTIVNHAKGNIRALVITAPSFGDRQVEMLKDIAILTGADFISAESGTGLQSVTSDNLGHAGRVTSSKDSTLIVEGAGDEKAVDERAEALKAEAASPDTSEFNREKLMERYAKFKSGVAVLMIGAKSEPEIKERKERAIDAVSAAKAALASGVVPGGGTALILAARSAAEACGDDWTKFGNDFKAGIDIVMAACQAPFRKLLSNAGYDAGEWFSQVKANKGFDVINGVMLDLTKVGIIDPVMVVRSALENASSNAVMLATTDVIIVEQPVEATK